MPTIIKQEELDYFIRNKKNVIFIGKHGVGKTAIIRQAFQRHFGDNCMYFSASTMDPWCDLVGIPRENNGILELVRPSMFARDEVRAIFMDEFNRAPKKVRNAVMELIQFKSINGHVFHNLEVVWAAINPEEDEDEKYDVDKLDPAQKDRFHAVVEIPYEPDMSYFTTKYGDNGKSAIEWWKELPKEQQNKVSPRRLDYALDIYNSRGDLRYVLDKTTHINKLINMLKSGPIIDRLRQLMEKTDEEITTFFLNENNFADAKKHIVKESKMIEKFLPCLGNEKIAMLISTNTKIRKYFKDNITNPKFLKIAENIVKASGNVQLTKDLQKLVSTIGKFDLSNTDKRIKAYEILSYKISNRQLTDESDIKQAMITMAEIVNRTNKLEIFPNIKLIMTELHLIGEKFANAEGNDYLKKLWTESYKKVQ